MVIYCSAAAANEHTRTAASELSLVMHNVDVVIDVGIVTTAAAAADGARAARL